MSALVVPPIRYSMTLEVPARRAFDAFTRGIGAWWPAENTWAKGGLAAMVLEPRPGGRWFERDASGVERSWGRVLSCSVPQRIVLGCGVSPEWKPEADPRRASRVEVRFVPQTLASVRVDLEHRDFGNHGAGAEALRRALAGEKGWANLLARYREATVGQRSS